ncbi:cation transporter [Prosthecochloris marina]|uniref:Cation transporter n=1 Tax=Prosthecochloris marina TaxID=2017681 RepID=A0A317T5J9_9CHLB|nr:CDF family Co(II)/Ni(II) efflux transporter DmeF [Prosthecochloris marina]PWW81520.1 cation transporter [Prosthecochloris marina]
MHAHTLTRWQHSHDFITINNKGEQRTRYVLLLTAVTMVAEIFAGSIYGSMALLADGWHMATHVAAFMITIFAYRYARKHANDPAFTFGTGKVTVLGGFSSAVALAVVALVMVVESLERIMNPQVIHFNEAITVATIGLLVNLVSAFMLKDEHAHHHHGHTHEHNHRHDHNLRAAYLHVLADALTSLLAIIALMAGKHAGWNWLDPVMGVVGAVVITRWSYGLLRETGPILLDASIEKEYRRKILDAIEKDADNKVSDMHIWKVGANDYAAIISLVTHFPNATEHYKNLLRPYEQLSHVTIEVQECKEPPCITPQLSGQPLQR